MEAQESLQNIPPDAEANLRSLAESPQIRQRSGLSSAQVDGVLQRVSKLLPARSVLNIIKNASAGRAYSAEHAKENTNALFEAMEKAKQTAVFGTVFVAPAAAIWAYQNLLRLVGVRPEDAFPEGTWQFYVEYALREDTGRHTTETHGFDSLFSQYHLQLTQIDRMTAWTMAAIHCLHDYPDLLRNEWRERVYIATLRRLVFEATGEDSLSRLYREWELQRPYSRGHDSYSGQTYAQYRAVYFDQFLSRKMAFVSPDIQKKWVQAVQKAKIKELPAYQKQMSILAYLEPNYYEETRYPILLQEAHVGLIYRGQYYLIPVCQEDGRPVSVTAVRAQIASLVQEEPDLPPPRLMELTRIQRNQWPALRPQLNAGLIANLERLHTAPVLLNFDQRTPELNLSKMRQAERGIGDHALTIFDAGKTFAFDLSHIFFDGSWGAALAEILTNFSSSWAIYLHRLPPAQTTSYNKPILLPLHLKADDWNLIKDQTKITPESSAETFAIVYEPIKKLRSLFRLRREPLNLTINDLLMLYRAIHALTYQPDPKLIQTLSRLRKDEKLPKNLVQEVLVAIMQAKANPSILMPVDASRHSPRDRLYPVSLTVPLEELDLLALHKRTLQMLNTNDVSFNKVQHDYLNMLAGLGQVFSHTKRITSEGESTSVGTIKLLAHLPMALQRFLDNVATKNFEFLNDVLKGREVFSNVGQVVPNSTLTRFMTAKDDNEFKQLSWGVITSASGDVCITLRDFRPHVYALIQAGYEDLAYRITQDYLDAYARGFNRFVQELMQIVKASPETELEQKRR